MIGGDAADGGCAKKKFSSVRFGTGVLLLAASSNRNGGLITPPVRPLPFTSS